MWMKNNNLAETLRKGCLYAITQDQSQPGLALAQAQALLQAGVLVLQLRNKSLTKQALAEEAKAIANLCRGRAWFLINDDPHLAKAVGANGVHLGQEDISAQAAREILGTGTIIGLSTHKPAEAQAALSQPVDYIGVGPLFPTTTKNIPLLAGLDYARWAAANISLPLVGIGGITLARASLVAATGVRTVAVISDVAQAKDLGGYVREMEEILRGKIKPS